MRDGGTGSFYVWFGDAGKDTTHWEEFGRIPPQGGPKADGMATTDEYCWEVGVSPAGKGDVGGGVTGGGDLRLLLPEHSCTVHCNHAHYVPMSSGREAPGVTDI